MSWDKVKTEDYFKGMLHVHYLNDDKIDGPILDILKEFCDGNKSNHEWRRLIKGKGLTVNNRELSANKDTMASHMINDLAIVRVGKKHFYTFIRKQ